MIDIVSIVGTLAAIVLIITGIVEFKKILKDAKNTSDTKENLENAKNTSDTKENLKKKYHSLVIKSIAYLSYDLCMFMAIIKIGLEGKSFQALLMAQLVLSIIHIVEFRMLRTDYIISKYKKSENSLDKLY